MNLYTTGDVCRRLDISERVLKYYVECKLFKPSKIVHSSSGKKTYWYFTDSDVNKIKQIQLYKELGYSSEDIKKYISKPEFDWKSALGSQISELREKKKHYENLITVAETMRYYYENGLTDGQILDISDLGNNLDSFALGTFASDDISKEALINVNQDISGGMNISEINKAGQDIIKMLIELSKHKTSSPESEEVQKIIKEMFDYLQGQTGMVELDSRDILFGLRLITNVSLESMLDSFFSQGATDYLFSALEAYCRVNLEEKENG